LQNPGGKLSQNVVRTVEKSQDSFQPQQECAVNESDDFAHCHAAIVKRAMYFKATFWYT
jgi:hypothetical protein